MSSIPRETIETHPALWIVPPFPGLLEELDINTAALTPPSSEIEWTFFHMFNKAREHPVDGSINWDELTSGYCGTPPRVVFEMGYHCPSRQVACCVDLGSFKALVPYPGLVKHFYYRIGRGLVKNGLEESNLRVYLTSELHLDKNYRPYWGVGYDRDSGNITILDRPHFQNFIRGHAVPRPSIYKGL